MTSFMPWSSAAVMPNPITKMKMYLTSLQRSVKTLKKPSGSSGNHHLSDTSTTPIQTLGTGYNNNITCEIQVNTNIITT